MVVLCALAIAPVAVAGGASATATPTHVKVGKSVQLKVTGLKSGERVKATEVIPAAGDQKRTLFPKQRASSTGVIVMTVRAQIKGTPQLDLHGPPEPQDREDVLRRQVATGTS